jgi:hypothetical protein
LIPSLGQVKTPRIDIRIVNDTGAPLPETMTININAPQVAVAQGLVVHLSRKEAHDRASKQYFNIYANSIGGNVVLHEGSVEVTGDVIGNVIMDAGTLSVKGSVHRNAILSAGKISEPMGTRAAAPPPPVVDDEAHGSERIFTDSNASSEDEEDVAPPPSKKRKRASAKRSSLPKHYGRWVNGQQVK